MYDLSGSHASPDGGVQHLQHRNLTSGSYAASPGLARTNSSRAAALGSPAENPAKVLFQDGEGQKGLEGNDSLCPRRKVSRGLTATLVYAAAILERADETILPAVYLFIGRSLHVSPSQLGAITLARAIVQALSSPLSGIIGNKYDRASVIGTGCVIWGLMTSCLGMAQSLQTAMMFSALNGFGLSLVIPSCQSMIADYYPAKDRGKAFGILYMMCSLGSLIGGILATNLGGREIFQMEGWRFFYQCVGLVSIACGAVVAAFAVDPRFVLHGSKTTEPPKSDVKGNLWPETLMIFRLRSFQVIIAQGIVGSMPWFCMGYLTLWFQLLGFTDLQASLLMAVFAFANAKGCLLGGFLGDFAAKLSPNHGRIIIAQISVASGIPLMVILLQVLPGLAQPRILLLLSYGAMLWVMGMLVSWCSAACNNPVFADIVPEHLRSMIYAYDRCLEGGIAAMITPVVGVIAEQVFHYKTAQPSHLLTAEERHVNARALADALTWTVSIPWAACFVCYSMLHMFYAHDRVSASVRTNKRDAKGDVEALLRTSSSDEECP